MEKQKRDMIILGVVVGLAVLAADWFVIMDPLFTGFSRKHQKIDELKRMISEAEKLRNEKETVVQKLDKVEKEFEKYNQKLPQEKDIPALLEQFNVKAEEAGIKFVKVATLPTIPHDSPKNIRVLER